VRNKARPAFTSISDTQIYYVAWHDNAVMPVLMPGPRRASYFRKESRQAGPIIPEPSCSARSLSYGVPQYAAADTKGCQFLHESCAMVISAREFAIPAS